MELDYKKKKILKNLSKQTMETGIIMNGVIETTDCYISDVKWNSKYNVYETQGFVWDEIGEDYIAKDSLRSSLDLHQIENLAGDIAIGLNCYDNKGKIKDILKKWTYYDRTRRTKRKEEDDAKSYHEMVCSYTDT
jgi:hypothetical protein